MSLQWSLLYKIKYSTIEEKNMKLQIIIGSTRPGRVSERVAKWVAMESKTLSDATVEIVDLADYPLPFLDEPISPQYNPERKPNETAQKLLDKLAEADAYAIVTPEYNRSYSGVLKNALDYVDFQFAKKPIVLVAHGSTGGAQAVSHLRGVIPGLHSITIPTAVYLQASNAIDEEGNLSEEVKANPYGPHAVLTKAMNELHWYSTTLAAGRTSA
jgi:NAD(P)H-dependent FMN reductase